MNKKMTKKDWMKIAQLEAKKSPCLKVQVGACLVLSAHYSTYWVRGRNYFSGYNSQVTPCGKCTRMNGEKGICTAIHAEEFAIMDFLSSGVVANNDEKWREGKLFVTMSPCISCCRWIIYSNVINEVFYLEEHYDITESRKLLRSVDINLVELLI